MLLKIKSLGLLTGRPIAIIHEKTATELSISQGERVRIKKDHSIVAVVNIATGLLKENEIYLSKEVIRHINAREGCEVEVLAELPPETTHYILDKLQGKELSSEQIESIIGDIVHNKLTEAEIAYFVSGVYVHNMTDKETSALTKSMVKFGKSLELKGQVYDKHSIGGIPGNRTTPLVISICAAAGLIMPKTSSRAITSAAGTADVIESLAKVDFSLPEIVRIVKKADACLVWGGSLGLAPADDKIVRVEKLISIDPQAQLLASILSKKLAVKSKGVLIDISYGKNAKVKTKKEAEDLKRKFERIGGILNMRLKVAITDGSQPIGNGVGPVLEARDVLLVLSRSPQRPLDLERKSLNLAGMVLEMSGKCSKGKGKILAKRLLESGKAFERFTKIIKAQGGKVDLEKLQPDKFSCSVLSKRSGKIKEINNKCISAVARAAGCPTDKGAGIYLRIHSGDKIKKNAPLLELYAESKEKLDHARRMFDKFKPIEF